MRHEPGTTVVSGGRLFDGTGSAPIPDAAVVVTDGRIAWAGAARDGECTPHRRGRGAHPRRTSTMPSSWAPPGCGTFTYGGAGQCHRASSKSMRMALMSQW